LAGIEIACAVSLDARAKRDDVEHVVNINFAPCSDARVTVASCGCCKLQEWVA